MFNPLPPNPGGFTWTGSPGNVLSWPATSSLSPQAALAQASVPSQGAPLSGAGSSQAQQDAEDARRWDQYLKQTQELLRQSAGMERWKLQQQLDDAQKGRDNAYRIAELSAQTSRYGTDRQAETELARLRENQRQFDANHELEKQRFGLEQQRFGLEQQKHGLNVAEAYTRYSQTPDMMFARNDLVSALGRVGQGQGPRNVMSQGSGPRPKTWEDFSALAGFGAVPAVQAGRTPGAVTAPADPPSMAGVAGGPPGAAGAGPDPRIKAMRAVADAMPPSDTDGADEQDWQALNAIHSLYFARKPGQVERLGQQRQKTAMAGLARLGYDPIQVEEDRQRSLPGQRSVRAA